MVKTLTKVKTVKTVKTVTKQARLAACMILTALGLSDCGFYVGNYYLAPADGPIIRVVPAVSVPVAPVVNVTPKPPKPDATNQPAKPAAPS